MTNKAADYMANNPPPMPRHVHPDPDPAPACSVLDCGKPAVHECARCDKPLCHEHTFWDNRGENGMCEADNAQAVEDYWTRAYDYGR
jgi:hypothetical protein